MTNTLAFVSNTSHEGPSLEQQLAEAMALVKALEEQSKVVKSAAKRKFLGEIRPLLKLHKVTYEEIKDDLFVVGRPQLPVHTYKDPVSGEEWNGNHMNTGRRPAWLSAAIFKDNKKDYTRAESFIVK
jgi:DNA-binding protein H-NS